MKETNSAIIVTNSCLLLNRRIKNNTFKERTSKLKSQCGDLNAERELEMEKHCGQRE